MRAEWSSHDAHWTIEAERGAETVRFSCGFLFMCSGYYDYAGGYTPEFAGTENFAGQVVHPQHWPEDLDYAGKRVVVIGSGATAVTLVPAMADKAAHVTMLQRSPTYVVSRPSEDSIANRLRQKLPAMLAYQLARWKNVLLGMYFFRLSRRKPEQMKARLLGLLRKQLGPDYDVATHFTPRYNPWDQRLCLVPDGDLFREINARRVSVVTDHIERFTPGGLKLQSGRELAADIVVTATGLRMKLFSGLQVVVDGARIELAKTMSYKGMMFSGVPNFAAAFGYTNASWTLKCDLTCEYVCRLLRYMDRHGYRRCMPQRDASVAEAPWLDFTSGYVQRALDQLPRQGAKKPWKLYQNYARDLMSLRFGNVNDGTMQFSK
jgi:cation diffusion facilitator CzcD-associated flavoprotein CzcO